MPRCACTSTQGATRIADIVGTKREFGEESSGEGLGVPAGMGLRPLKNAQEERGSVR